MRPMVSQGCSARKFSLPAEDARHRGDWSPVKSAKASKQPETVRPASSKRTRDLRLAATQRGQSHHSQSPLNATQPHFPDDSPANDHITVGKEPESTVANAPADASAASECPLSDPHFPPIGEIDHKVGRCYCYLCTCGSHLCPMAFQQARFSQNLSTSCYRAEYRKKETTGNTLQFLLKPAYVPNALPIDLMTTKQRDFRPFTIESPKHSKPSTAPNPLKFSFRSSYQSEFPNWGPSTVPEERRPNLPYRGAEVKMDLKTTYGKDFTAHKTTEDTMSRFGSTAGSTVFVYPTAAKVEFCGETTTGKEYRSPRRIDKVKVERRPVEQHALSESPRKIHFQSKYQREFGGQQLQYRLPPRANLLL